MNVGRVAMVFGLLPVVFGLERFAHFGLRSMLAAHLASKVGMSVPEVAFVFGVRAYAMFVTYLLGGLLAAVIKPAATLAVGLALTAAGHALLFMTPAVSGVWIGAGTLALGNGVMLPSVYALAAQELRASNEHLRNGAFILLLVAAELAGFAAPLATSALIGATSTQLTLGAFAVVMTLALLASVALAVGWARFEADRPLAAPPSPPIDRVVAGAAGLLALVSLLIALSSFVRGAKSSLAAGPTGLPAAIASLLFDDNPIALLAAAGILFFASMLLHFGRIRSSALFAVALGTCITAAATLPVLLGMLSPSVLVALSATSAVAYVLVFPFALSRFSGDLPPRLAPALIGVWLAVGSLAGSSSWGLQMHLRDWNPLMTAITAGLALLLGVALLFAARPLARRLYEPGAPAPVGSSPIDSRN